MDPNKDFRILEEARKKIEEFLTFDEYIEFAILVCEFSGHPQRPQKPITGNAFLL
jgi:hypothetical protein